MGLISRNELDDDLRKAIENAGDSTELNGKPASYYDQNAHVTDESVHVTEEMKQRLDTFVTETEAYELKEEAVTESSEYTDNKLGELINVSGDVYNELMRVATLLVQNPDTLTALMEAIALKLDKTVFEEHLLATNPHNIGRTEVGLGNVDNTADKDKVVLAAKKLETKRTITFTGDATGSVDFDGTNNVECKLEVTGEDMPAVTPGKYTQVTIDDKGRVTEGYNPQTLKEYGIIDAATKDQGKKADTAIQDIYVGLWGKAKVIEGTAFLPAYPTDAETLGGKAPDYYAVNTPATNKTNGIMTAGMYQRLYGNPTEFDIVNMYKDDIDENGIYRTVKYYLVGFDENNVSYETLYKESFLLGEGPNYQQRRDVIYFDGMTITTNYTLTYDENGSIISEVVNDRVVESE